MIKNKKIIFISLSAFILCIGLFKFATPANASILDQIKSIINKNLQKDLRIDQEIVLVNGGDFDENNQINSGDIVKYTFKITNPTSKSYTLSTLNTNIDRSSINFIHNIIGTSGIQDNGKTITIPNITINPSSVTQISFDARINYFDESSKTLTIQPELIDRSKKSIYKSDKTEVVSKKSKTQQYILNKK